MTSHADIEKRFTYHAPDEKKITVHQEVRNEARLLAHKLNLWIADSREKSLALTHLEEMVFWANAAIAREGLNPPSEVPES